MMDEKVYAVHMGKAKCAVDLGDGSERGEYVNQDYILQVLGRPHRSISLMYCSVRRGMAGQSQCGTCKSECIFCVGLSV